MRRGEVWWAQLPPPVGRRPVVLVSRDEAYAIRELVTVVPITTQVRGIPVEVLLGRDEGLLRRSVANTDSLTTIPKWTLRQYAVVSVVDNATAIDAALRFALLLQ